MANDVHYIFVFVAFFLLLGLISPLINEEFNGELTEDNTGLDIGDENQGSATIFVLILNILALPFWTFGLPFWLNLWILVPIRVSFIFVVARNIWIGGGG